MPTMFLLDASNKILKELNAYAKGNVELKTGYQVGCVAPAYTTESESQAEIKYNFFVNEVPVVLTRSQRLIAKLNDNYQFLFKRGNLKYCKILLSID